ncbi:MAG: DNA translocase FtsK 4TM domain-containing protein, partial [Pseudomonadota bacterium]
MAYQVRQRDPLLDSNVQISLARRGREGLGVVVALMGLLLFAILFSYHPEDPNWLAATDAPAQNWFGIFGASIAAPLHLILGYGSYGLALGGLVWGARFAFHWGSERALPRALFVGGWVLVLSIYWSSTPPGANWVEDHGLGGMFGDTIMGAILAMFPFGAAFALKVLSFLLGIGSVGLGVWVMGFTRDDLLKAGLFLLAGFGSAWHIGLVATGTVAKGAATGTAKTAVKLKERRLAKVQAQALQEEPQIFEESRAPLLSIGSLKQGLSSLLPKGRALPDYDDREEPDLGAPIPEDAPQDDRIQARIANAVRTRVRRANIAQALAPAPTAEPALRADPTAAPVRAEPPLTAMPPAPAVDAPQDEDPLIESDAPEPAPETVTFSHTPAQPALNRRVVQAQAKPAKPSSQAKAEAQPALQFEDKMAAYETPPLALLADPGTVERHHLSDDALEQNARMLEAVLDDYGVKGEIVSVRPGPVVTMYELEPAPGLKASRVIGLADDIARSMSALSARVSTVPGRSVIGIELPNEKREKVVLREILAVRDFGDSTQALPLALGKDIGGAPIVANLAKMPHLLIAGTTGSGKSVAINTMILSLLYKLTPEECRMIMIDPKMLELSVYDGIPHLLSPVVTDPKKAVVALKWVVGEMEDRYRKMSKMGVRNIDGFNGRVKDALSKGEMFSRTVQTGFDDETGEPVFETEETVPEKMPYIVVIVDE